MDSPDPPPAPDYTATAREQGELNKQAVAQQAFTNRPTQITPWGRMDWQTQRTVDPATGQPVTAWTQTQTLDPALQEALTGQFGIGGQRTAMAQDIFGRVRGAMGEPVDYSQFRDVPDVTRSPELRERAEQAAYGRITSRLDPRLEREQERLEIDLRNKGLRPGDEAYDAAVDNFERARTDAYAAAEADATAAGRAEAGQMFGQQQAQQAQAAALRQQEINEALGRRALPLDEVNMLLAGQGIQPPSMPGFTAARMAQPANLLGAAQAQYGAEADRWSAQQAQRQSLLSGLMGVGRMGLSAYGMGMFG